MKARLMYLANTVIAPLLFCAFTVWFAKHDAQTILPPEKRSEFILTIFEYQLGGIFTLQYIALRRIKNPEKFLKFGKIVGFTTFVPLLVLFYLSWYLQFWPGPYR